MVTIVGVVESGRQLGRQLGFPTANVAIVDGEDIPTGVFLSRVEVDGVWHKAITNIGTNPTVGLSPCRSESYIFDFDRDIYGKEIRVEILKHLRDERKFDSVEQLRAQIASDIESATSEF